MEAEFNRLKEVLKAAKGNYGAVDKELKKIKGMERVNLWAFFTSKRSTLKKVVKIIRAQDASLKAKNEVLHDIEDDISLYNAFIRIFEIQAK